MRQHHALGEAGRAAGVEDAREVVAGAEGVLGGARVVDQRLVAQDAVGRRFVARVYDEFDRRAGGGDLVFG
jgi:hypothetical protein